MSEEYVTHEYDVVVIGAGGEVDAKKKKKKLMNLLKYQLLTIKQIEINLQKIMLMQLHQVQKNI